MSGVITSAVVGVAGLGMAAYSASQQGKAASQASKVTSTQLGMETTQFNEQQGFYKQLQDLLANPSSVTSLPGYQFNFDQGVQAVARSNAAGGFLNSGNMAAAETQFGQGLATSTFNQQAQLLASLSGLNPSAFAGAAVGGANATTAANSAAASTTSGALNSFQFMNLLGQQKGWWGGVPGSSSDNVLTEVQPAGQIIGDPSLVPP